MTVTFYFIRHGQSVDNTNTTIWSGWRDSPLTQFGQRQAEALGTAFSNRQLAAVYTSTLKRAHSTGLALAAGQHSPPTVTTTPDLREQYFGIAEGKRHAFSGSVDLQREVFPIQRGRKDCFPEGESRDDVRARGERVLGQLLMSHVWAARGRPATETHIAVVSHGICIAELVAAFLGRVPPQLRRETCWFGGVHNTAYHTLEVSLEDELFAEGPDELAPLAFDSNAPLSVIVKDVNNKAHLAKLIKAPGGLGSIASDPAQNKITAYLAGNTKAIECDGPGN